MALGPKKHEKNYKKFFINYYLNDKISQGAKGSV